MNILDLKRSLLPMRGARMPSESDGGNGSEGTSGASSEARGGDGYGGGGNDSLGLSNYGALADAATGYNPATGFTTTQVSAPGLNNYGYSGSTANQDRTNVGVNGVASSREASLAAEVLAFFDENPWARAIPFATVVENVARAGKKLGGAYSDSEVASVANSLGAAGNQATNGDGSGGAENTYNVGGWGLGGSGNSNSGGSQSVIDALAGTLSMTSPASGWGDYVKNILPKLQTQADKVGALGDAASTAAQKQSVSSLATAEGMNKDYNDIYRPFGQKMANEVNTLGSKEYEAQQRDAAMARERQLADSNMQSEQRRLNRMRVNPSSGKALAFGNQNAIATAAAMTGAAAKSDAAVKSNYLQGLSSMNNFGTTLQTQARANESQGMDWSKFGLATGMTGLGVNTDLSKLTTATASTFGGLDNQAKSVANGATQIANQQNQYDNSNDLWNLTKSAAAGAAVKGLGNYLFS